MKTNAMRLLDKAKINYKVIEYEVDEDNIGGLLVAEKLSMSADEVFKTLVTVGDKKSINVFCIPINCELNLKKAATVSGNKKIEMLQLKDVLATTGYIRGACSPVGMKKAFPTFIDETALLFDTIGVSAGAKGLELIIEPESLANYVNAKFCDIT